MRIVMTVFMVLAAMINSSTSVLGLYLINIANPLVGWVAIFPSVVIINTIVMVSVMATLKMEIKRWKEE